MKASQHHLDTIRARARSGFETRKTLNEEIAQIGEYQLDNDAQAMRELKAAAEAELQKLANAEKTWKKPTVNDRIDAAFEAIRDEGIIVLPNAGYTMSDGWTEVNGVRSDLQEDGIESRGAIFYHGEDLEAAVRGEPLLLAFGAYATPKARNAANIEIARTAVEILERYGVGVEWDGSERSRIVIHSFPWQQRMKTRAPKIVPLPARAKPVAKTAAAKKTTAKKKTAAKKPVTKK